MQTFLLAPNSPGHLFASPGLSGLKSSAPNPKQGGPERHQGHPADLYECTFEDTLTKQHCLPDPYLVHWRNEDALAHWFSDGQGSSMGSPDVQGQGIVRRAGCI